VEITPPSFILALFLLIPPRSVISPENIFLTRLVVLVEVAYLSRASRPSLPFTAFTLFSVLNIPRIVPDPPASLPLSSHFLLPPIPPYIVDQCPAWPFFVFVRRQNRVLSSPFPWGPILSCTSNLGGLFRRDILQYRSYLTKQDWFGPFPRGSLFPIWTRGRRLSIMPPCSLFFSHTWPGHSARPKLGHSYSVPIYLIARCFCLHRAGIFFFSLLKLCTCTLYSGNHSPMRFGQVSASHSVYGELQLGPLALTLFAFSGHQELHLNFFFPGPVVSSLFARCLVG